MTTTVRPAAVAGTFYPGRADDLRLIVDDALAGAPSASAGEPRGASSAPPKALIVPHAGYVYSGPVAATAYAALVPWRDAIERIVLLGPAHRVPVRSMAVSAADAWQTPLGAVPIDVELRRRIAAMPGMVTDDRPHGPEHSLEVHVPFLQRVLGHEFTLLPIIVGAAPPEEVADVLDVVWGGAETVIVVSTDLSHYHGYAEARRRDAGTIASIVAGRGDEIGPHDACGVYPVKGMLEAARRHHLAIEAVDARNSGDTAGPRDQVVGYASFVLRADEGTDPGTTQLDAGDRATLLAIAEEAVRAELEGRKPQLSDDLGPRLREPGAAFVTLKDPNGQLLGCIGTIEPIRPLAADVADDARGAAFRDPRLPALTADEFAAMSIHISVMTPIEPMEVDRFDDLRRVVRPGIDGLLIEAGRHRATFLPSVWEQLPSVDEYLEHLWRKAGLTPGTWPAGLRVARYGTIEWGEDGPRPPVAR